MALSPLNITFQDQDGQDALSKQFSDLHGDEIDRPTDFTCIINLSFLEDDFFGGLFNIPLFKMSFMMRRGEAVIFPANFYHCATGAGPYDVPIGDPRRLVPGLPMPVLPAGTKHKRILAIPHPNEQSPEPDFGWWDEELWTVVTEKVFETPLGHANFMLSSFICHEPQIRPLLNKKD